MEKKNLEFYAYQHKKKIDRREGLDQSFNEEPHMKAKWDGKPGEMRKGVCYENQYVIITAEEKSEGAHCWQAKEEGGQEVCSFHSGSELSTSLPLAPLCAFSKACASLTFTFSLLSHPTDQLKLSPKLSSGKISVICQFPAFTKE